MVSPTGLTQNIHHLTTKLCGPGPTRALPYHTANMALASSRLDTLCLALVRSDFTETMFGHPGRWSGNISRGGYSGQIWKPRLPASRESD